MSNNMNRRKLTLGELEKISGGYTGAVSFCDEDFYYYNKPESVKLKTQLSQNSNRIHLL